MYIIHTVTCNSVVVGHTLGNKMFKILGYKDYLS